MKKERRQQTARVTIRLLPEVKKQLEIDAEKAGLSLSGLVKHRVCGEAAALMPTKQKRIAPDLKLLSKIMGELGKWGNNLNQIAYHLNKAEGVQSEKINLLNIERHLNNIKNTILRATGITL